MTKLTFSVEIEADNETDAEDAYSDLITSAIEISNSSFSAHITVMEAVQGDADPLSIPSAADLRKSRLADAGEDMLSVLESTLYLANIYGESKPGRDGLMVNAFIQLKKLAGPAIAKAKGEEIA